MADKTRKWWGLTVNGEIRVVEDHEVKPTIWDFDCPIDEGRDYGVIQVSVEKMKKGK